MPNVSNETVILLGVIQFVMIILLGVLGWAIRSIFADVKKAISELKATLEEMTEKFFEHQIVDAGTTEKIHQLRRDVTNHKERLDRHSLRIDDIEKDILKMK